MSEEKKDTTGELIRAAALHTLLSRVGLETDAKGKVTPGDLKKFLSKDNTHLVNSILTRLRMLLATPKVEPSGMSSEEVMQAFREMKDLTVGIPDPMNPLDLAEKRYREGAWDDMFIRLDNGKDEYLKNPAIFEMWEMIKMYKSGPNGIQKVWQQIESNGLMTIIDPSIPTVSASKPNENIIFGMKFKPILFCFFLLLILGLAWQDVIFAKGKLSYTEALFHSKLFWFLIVYLVIKVAITFITKNFDAVSEFFDQEWVRETITVILTLIILIYIFFIK